jgi:hypothetical protein
MTGNYERFPEYQEAHCPPLSAKTRPDSAGRLIRISECPQNQALGT